MLAVTGEEVCEPRVEMSWDAIGKEFGEQGRVPDRIESTKYVERDALISYLALRISIYCLESRSSISRVE